MARPRPMLTRGRGANMLVIGCDYHPSVQHIAWMYTETGECSEKQLRHSDGEAEKFYRDLKAKGVEVRVGIEATGHARWFEHLLAELKFELWVGDPAQIKATRVRKHQERSSRCRAHLETDDGRTLSTGVGTRSGESRSAAAVVASAPLGTDAHAGHESVASCGAERRSAAEKGTVEPVRTGAVRVLPAGAMGDAAAARAVAVARPVNSLYRGVNDRHRARSRAVFRCATFDDSSWSGSDHGPGLCVDHRISGALWLRQADRQLPGADPVRGLQRGPAT